MIVRVAAAQYPIDAISSWESWQDKLSAWFAAAAAHDAKLLVFPEYGAMELARMAPADVWSDLEASIDFVTGLRPQVDAFHAELAARHRVHVIASSLPCRMKDGTVQNVARVFAPGGQMGEQSKLMMTPFERNIWHIDPGSAVRVFDTDIGMLGVAICYDSEFPLIARAMSEAGAAILAVPSCTEAPRGYHRVRVAAQARALENQFHVVQAPTVGDALWSPAVDRNTGAAGIYGPPDNGFPEDGVIAMGALNEPQWVFGDLDLAAVSRVRLEGAVLNDSHWREQPGARPLAAEVVSLK